MNDGPRANPLLSGAFVRVTLSNFFFFLNFASFFLLPLHVKAMGGDESTVGAVMGTAPLAGLFVIPIVGATIDRYGRRRYLLVGSGVMALVSWAYLFIDGIGPALFVARVVQGMSFVTAFTASTTLAAELTPPARRAQALGLFGVSTLTTHAIAPAVGEEIVRAGGFDALFVFGAVLALIGVGLAFTLPRDRALALPHRPAGPRWKLGPVQRSIGVTMAFCGIAFGSVVTFIPTFVAGAGLGRVGVFFAAYTGAAILSRVAGGSLSDSLGRRAVVLPMLVLLSASILLLSVVDTPTLLVVAALLFGFAHGMSYPALNAFAVDLSTPENLGQVQALFNGAFNLGSMSSAFLFGGIANRFGYPVMFTVASVSPLLAWIVFQRATRNGETGDLSSTAGREAA